MERQAGTRQPWEGSLLLDFILMGVGMEVESFPAQGEQNVESSGHKGVRVRSERPSAGLTQMAERRAAWDGLESMGLKGKPRERT